jgi:delta8-fatty-acid desaturase
MDPDIQHLPFLAISNKMLGNKFFSTYHNKWFQTDAAARFLVMQQKVMFYPIMSLARFNLYVQSWILLLVRTDEPIPNRLLECCSLAGFWVWLFLLMSFLPTWGERFAFLYVSHGAAGILHIQITLSHFISDVFHGRSEESWIAHQMKTTTDITCPTYMDWFHGGLQFQLEHHLFPRLPRHNLRIARDQIIKLSLKHNLPYAEMSFIEANKTLLGILEKTAKDAEKLTKGDAGFYESPIYEAFNAQG